MVFKRFNFSFKFRTNNLGMLCTGNVIPIVQEQSHYKTWQVQAGQPDFEPSENQGFCEPWGIEQDYTDFDRTPQTRNGGTYEDTEFSL